MSLVDGQQVASQSDDKNTEQALRAGRLVHNNVACEEE